MTSPTCYPKAQWWNEPTLPFTTLDGYPYATFSKSGQISYEEPSYALSMLT